jgi:hypothetical protein
MSRTLASGRQAAHDNSEMATHSQLRSNCRDLSLTVGLNNAAGRVCRRRSPQPRENIVELSQLVSEANASRILSFHPQARPSKMRRQTLHGFERCR